MHLNALKTLLATVALIAGDAHAAPTLKLGLTTWIGYSPFYVADALDLYKNYGLKVKQLAVEDGHERRWMIIDWSVDASL